MKRNIFILAKMISLAVDNVRAHKFRSFLTVLGVVIGVVVVIVVASILNGLKSNIVKSIEEYGTNNIYAFHLSNGLGIESPDRNERKRKPLRIEDGEALVGQAPAVEEVANQLSVTGINSTLAYKGSIYRHGRLQGVSANYYRAANISIREGRFFSETDDHHRRPVMVIGMAVAEALFPHGGTIIGRNVTMDGKPFEIVGVLNKRKGGFFGENEEDNAIFVPLKTAQKISPRSNILLLIVRAKPGQIGQALDQVESVLRRQRGLKQNERNDFDLSTADRLIQQFDNVTVMVGLVAIAVSSIGLIVGGIGVMNIMLVIVTERTQEIGIRRALGARRIDIVSQFLLEAVVLTLLGGAFGIILALGINQLISLLILRLPLSVPLWAVITGLFVSIFVGLIFGVWPAKKAARLDPIECLRYE